MASDAELLISSLTSSLERLVQSLDAAAARLVRLEATANMHVALHTALIRTHPDPDLLREAWLQTSSVMLAHSAMHDGEQQTKQRYALIAQDTAKHITEMIDEVVEADRRAG
jgi:hypothetical protein